MPVQQPVCIPCSMRGMLNSFFKPPKLPAVPGEEGQAQYIQMPFAQSAACHTSKATCWLAVPL